MNYTLNNQWYSQYVNFNFIIKRIKDFLRKKIFFLRIYILRVLCF